MRIQQFSDLSQNVKIPRAAFLKLVLEHMNMLNAGVFKLVLVHVYIKLEVSQAS